MLCVCPVFTLERSDKENYPIQNVLPFFGVADRQHHENKEKNGPNLYFYKKQKQSKHYRLLTISQS